MSSDYLHRSGLRAALAELKTLVHEISEYNPTIGDMRYPRAGRARRLRTVFLYVWVMIVIYYAGAALNVFILTLERGLGAVFDSASLASILLLEPILRTPALGIIVFCALLVLSISGFLSYQDLKHEQAVVKLRAQSAAAVDLIERLRVNLAQIREQILVRETELKSTDDAPPDSPIDADSNIPLETQIETKVSQATRGAGALSPEERKELGQHVLSEALSIALRSPKVKTRLAVVAYMARMGDLAPVEPVIIALADSDMEIHAAAVQILKRLEPAKVIPLLESALQSSDTEERKAAIWALGQIGDQESVKLISRFVEDEDTNVRKEAILALQRVPDQIPVGPLVAALSDSEWEVRKAAVETLTEIANRVPTEPILAMLNDPEWPVRASAIGTLVEMADRITAEPLIAALDDEQPEVREVAVRALGRLGDRVPLEAIRRMLDDADSTVRLSARWTLWSLGQDIPPELGS